MTNFKDIITADIDWRRSEIATLRSIPLRYNMLPYHRDTLIKYSIPSLYALWEGYVKNTFITYIKEINSLNLTTSDTNINLLVYAMTSVDKLRLENSRMTFQKKREYIECYQSKIFSPLSIEHKIPTKSNVDFNVINEILTIFNLSTLSTIYEPQLKKLLFFRNSVAHGETSIPITQKDVSDFSNLLVDLMTEIFIIIEDGYMKQTYRN